jgi:hypothetical protein
MLLCLAFTVAASQIFAYTTSTLSKATAALSSTKCLRNSVCGAVFQHTLLVVHLVKKFTPISFVFRMFGVQLTVARAGYPEILRFPQSLRPNGGISQIRPRPLPSTPFPTHSSLIVQRFDDYNLGYDSIIK